MRPARTLLESAQQFLTEALVNHRDGKMGFAIVHVVTATELVLKERLNRIHPSLIFRNIDTKDFTNERTVELRNLPQRLINLGVSIDEKEAKQIADFAAWRNEIVHHMPSFDEREVRLQIPRMLNFLAVFLRRELATPLETFLPRELYKTAHAVLEYWQKVVGEGQKECNRGRERSG